MRKERGGADTITNTKKATGCKMSTYNKQQISKKNA